LLDSVRRLALVAAVPVVLFGLAVTPARAGNPVPETPAAPVLTAPVTSQTLGEEVVALTNEERANAGCEPLAVEEELQVAAVRQSHYMAATGDFGHFGWRGSTFLSRSRAAGYHAVAAENVAFGYSGATEVMAAWMDSPPHRRNILNCDVKSFGAGVQRAVNGTIYWTQVFGWR
jgi:uncharacterized protein YkwD